MLPYTQILALSATINNADEIADWLDAELVQSDWRPVKLSEGVYFGGVIDFANGAISRGKNADEALIEAGEKRLRPILMTTIAMVFAMLPLAIGDGLGSEVKAPMAISIIGGLLSSMILTLLNMTVSTLLKS